MKPKPTSKTVKKLRVYAERSMRDILVKPQWLYRDEWHDFKEEERPKRSIKGSVPLAKFHGLEIAHLTNSRILRETRKCIKWLENWKEENESKAVITRWMPARSEQKKIDTKKDKKKGGVSLCAKCGKQFRFHTAPVQEHCGRCRIELDYLSSLESEAESKDQIFE